MRGLMARVSSLKSWKSLRNMTENTGTIDAALRILFDKNVRYATVIDLGSADGHFFLGHLGDGMFAGAVGVNVDANPLYEPSLRAIADTVGGHYVIAAVSDREGELEMTTAIHPYWNSLRPEGDLYWEQMNHLSQGKVRVPAVTVDSLKRRFNLAGPFLIKMDVQGAEAAVLRGAKETLAETSVIICETDLYDFRAIDRLLEEAGFALFDLTEMRRIADQSLGWFYPIYLNRKLDAIKRRSFWDTKFNALVVQKQKERRDAILAHNAELLEKLRRARKT
jgi:FkbM family methyltransferase